jgi:hypothetical protein
MNTTAIGFEPGVSEITETGLDTNASIHIRPPRNSRQSGCLGV